MVFIDDATMTQLRQATALARGKKIKKVVDTRASKGRKIRYHVHEKVQNFMIPIEAGTFRAAFCPSGAVLISEDLGADSETSHCTRTGNWHDEQIDELFASLLGKSFGNGAADSQKQQQQPQLDPALDDMPNQQAGQIEVGSLRLFG